MPNCVGCDAPLPPMAYQGQQRKWCSGACRVGFTRFGPMTARPCKRCGDPFLVRERVVRQAFCSRVCGWRSRDDARPRNADWANGHRTPRPVACTACGSTMVSPASRPMCPGCRDQRARDRAPDMNRRKNVKRRGVPRGSYRLNDIGDRDGWRCHLCQRKVDRTLSGSLPEGPTIDHLVPLSRGGSDNPDNVALAHRSCNVKRGTKGLVQLRLAA